MITQQPKRSGLKIGETLIPGDSPIIATAVVGESYWRKFDPSDG